MDIGEVIKQSGLPASALRFYEEKGLIQSCGRAGLRRQYADSIIERLGLIALARKAGFSLEEIADMFRVGGAINRQLLTQKADELDKKITELSAMRDGLRHAAACTASSHFECPKFLRLLRIAGRSRLPNKLK
jgi:DNA-binding transcriptional MerR regulator